jgi:hypothetical protein
MKALMTLVLALLVAGCAAGRDDGAGSAPTQEEPTANATEETTVLKRKLPSSLPQNHRIARSPMADEK